MKDGIDLRDMEVIKGLEVLSGKALLQRDKDDSPVTLSKTKQLFYRELKNAADQFMEKKKKPGNMRSKIGSPVRPSTMASPLSQAATTGGLYLGERSTNSNYLQFMTGNEKESSKRGGRQSAGKGIEVEIQGENLQLDSQFLRGDDITSTPNNANSNNSNSAMKKRKREVEWSEKSAYTRTVCGHDVDFGHFCQMGVTNPSLYNLAGHWIRSCFGNNQISSSNSMQTLIPREELVQFVSPMKMPPYKSRRTSLLSAQTSDSLPSSQNDPQSQSQSQFSATSSPEKVLPKPENTIREVHINSGLHFTREELLNLHLAHWKAVP